MMQGAKVEADTLRMQMSVDKSRSLRDTRAGPRPPSRHYGPRLGLPGYNVKMLDKRTRLSGEMYRK